jgi:hypothetical protein
VKTLCTEGDVQFLQLFAYVFLGAVLLVGKLRVLVDGSADIPHPIDEFCIRMEL